MKKSTLILISLLVAGGLACTKQQVQATYDKQETTIENFVKAQLLSDTTATVTYKNGTVRVVVHDTLQREGVLKDTLQAGGMVSFYYAGYVLTGTSVSPTGLFATNHKATAEASAWNLSDTTRYNICTLTLDDTLIPGLRNGLEGVRNQDECYILFSGEYGYGNRSQGTIPALSALVYHVWVNSITNE